MCSWCCGREAAGAKKNKAQVRILLYKLWYLIAYLGEWPTKGKVTQFKNGGEHRVEVLGVCTSTSHTPSCVTGCDTMAKPGAAEGQLRKKEWRQLKAAEEEGWRQLDG